MFRLASLCALLAAAWCAAPAQPPAAVAPVERQAFATLTSYDSLQAFLATLGSGGRCTVAPLATTTGGRRVSVVSVTTTPPFGSDTTKLRVLLFAQQHGDEPSGKEALTMLLARLARGELDTLLGRMDLLIVPQMNPDGAELRQRRTADSVDLNRSHLLLLPAQTRALHDLFDRWWPEVSMDIHEYQPRSEEWAKAGFLKAADVQLGMLTNLNSRPAIAKFEHASIYPAVASAMRAAGYFFHEYIVGTPADYVRYSTTEPNDGRQGFGMLGTVSFIQEGRNGRTLEDNLRRRAESQFTSILALLRSCASQVPAIRALVARERNALKEGRELPVVLCMDHATKDRVMPIPVFTVPAGRDSSWTVHPLRDIVEPLCTRLLPSAYIIPKELASVQEVVLRHKAHTEILTDTREAPVEVYTIESVVPDTLEDEWHPKPTLHVETVQRTLQPGDMIVRTDQVRSLLLGVLLEPESMWGLVKYPGFAFLLQGKEYPILRIP